MKEDKSDQSRYILLANSLWRGVLLGLILGGIFGWYIFMKSTFWGFSLVAILTVAFLVLHIVIGLGQVKNKIATTGIAVVYVLLLLLANLVPPTDFYIFPLSYIFVIGVSIIFLGLLVISISMDSWSESPHAFHIYIQKFLENSVVTGLLFIPVAFCLALINGLLMVSNIYFDINFLLALLSGTLPFVALGLIYDFIKVKIGDQQEKYAIVTLFTYFFAILGLIFPAFLLLYLLLLVPTHFQAILSTGSTVEIFLGVAFLTMIAIYFFRQAIQQKNLLVKQLRFTLPLFVIEALILNAVAVYALYLRITNYGFTVQRYFVLIILFFFLVMLLWYTVILLWHAVGKDNQKKVAAHIERAQMSGSLLLVVVGIIFLTVNFQSLSINQQLDRALTQDTLDNHLDRYYMQRGGEKTLQGIEKRYSQTNLLVARLDMLLIVYDIGHRSIFKDNKSLNADPDNNATKLLLKLKSQELQAEVKNFIDFLLQIKKSDIGVFVNKKNQTLENSCIPHIMNLLKIKHDQAQDFCLPTTTTLSDSF